MRTLSLTLVMICLTALVSFTACKKDKQAQIEPVPTFTLGVILPMDQDKGPQREKALRTAIDEINEAGGVGPGYRIELMVRSSEGANRETAAAEAASTIVASAENLVGFITSFSSSTKGVVEQVAIPGGYPVLSGSATSGTLSGISPYFSRLCPPDEFEAIVLTRQATLYGLNTVAIATEGGDLYSGNLASAFQEAFEGGVSATVQFHENDPDYTAKLDQLLSGNPEAIFISMLNPEIYTEFLTRLSGLGADGIENTTFILSDGLFSSALLLAPVDIMIGEVNGHPKNFGAMPSADTASGPYQCFQAELMDRYHQEVYSYNAQFYDIGYLFAMAIEKTLAETDPSDMSAFREQVRDLIRDVSHGKPGDPPVMPTLGWKSMQFACRNNGVDYVGASGDCNIDSQGNAFTPYALFKIGGEAGSYHLTILSIVYP